MGFISSLINKSTKCMKQQDVKPANQANLLGFLAMAGSSATPFSFFATPMLQHNEDI